MLNGGVGDDEGTGVFNHQHHMNQMQHHQNMRNQEIGFSGGEDIGGSNNNTAAAVVGGSGGGVGTTSA